MLYTVQDVAAECIIVIIQRAVCICRVCVCGRSELSFRNYFL